MPFHSTHLCAAILAATAVLATGPAFAQATTPAAPAGQGQPAQGAAPQAPPPGPMRIQLSPAQADWTKVCGKGPGQAKELCFTTRDFFAAPNQPPIALAVYEVKGDETRIVRVLLPTAVLLRPGIRVSVDKGAAQEGSYEFCLPNGCFAESKVKPATVDAMKKGTYLNVIAKNMANDEVTFQIPVAGFGKAFDGPAIDPKVLQAQQEQQQRDLQRQLEERAKQQRQSLEGAAPGGAAPPAGAPAPAPAPAK